MVTKILICLFPFLLSSISTGPTTLKEKLNQRAALSATKVPKEIKVIMKKSLDDLEKSGLAQKSIKKGLNVPKASVVDLKNNKIPLKQLSHSKYTLLTFYRGHWCPYCLLELKEYQSKLSDFKEEGIAVIGLAPDTLKEIKKMKKKHHLTFPIYRDENLEAAKAFGIKFALDNELKGVYQKFGIDLAQSQGNSQDSLPLPGTYVWNQKGEIVYAFVNPDYRKRAEPSEVLEEIKKLKN